MRQGLIRDKIENFRAIGHKIKTLKPIKHSKVKQTQITKFSNLNLQFNI